MAKNEPLRRYFIEIEKIKTSFYPSIEDIADSLQRWDINKSERTIERDIEQIRKNFGVEIIYEPQERGYYIDETQSPNLKKFLRFLELANTAHLFLSGITQTKDFIKDIDFDEKGGLMGTEHLYALLKAIKHNNKIRFQHFNYLTNEKKEMLVAPYFLKEYLGRWYVVGLRDDEKIRTFGIDRISDLEITEHKFTKKKEKEARENFESIIGLVYSYGKRQKVVLSFTPVQGRYIKSFPWHHSQRVLIDNEEECRISLNVIPNYELYQQILMQADQVKVLEPQQLVDEIKNKLSNALSRY